MNNPDSASPREGLKILVADDTPLNLHLASKLLTRKGHQVVAVDNGVKVLTAIEKEMFDAILMDLQMPVMDGIEATQKIRQSEARGLKTNRSAPEKKIPIIALTANDERGAHKTCLDAGMDGVIAKPIEVKTLMDTITAIIDQSESSA